MNEEQVLLTADFYNESRTWRNELVLAGHICRASVSATDILWVETQDHQVAWMVQILTLGPYNFRVMHLGPKLEQTVELTTAEEVMTHISEEIRDLH